MEWISVDDRLPEHETEVDIYLKSGIRITECLYTEYEDSGPHFYDERNDAFLYPYTDVTHWMPLPEPPK